MKANRIKEVKLSELKVWDEYLIDAKELKLCNLIKSIKKNGQASPLIVREVTKKNSNFKYEIIDGARRFYALKKILKSEDGLALVNIKKITNKSAALLQAIDAENRTISGHNRAKYYQKVLKSNNMSQAELAEKIGIAKSTMTRRMAYLKIDERILSDIDDQFIITDAMASAIVSLCNKANKISSNVYSQTLTKIIKTINTKNAINDEDIKKISLVLNKNNKNKDRYSFLKVKENIVTINKSVLKKVDAGALYRSIDKTIARLTK